MKNIIWLYSLAVGLFYIFIIGIVSGVVIDTTSGWYLSLNFPVFYPPKLLFSIAWGIAYLLFALLISSIMTSQRVNVRAYVIIAAVTLLNIIWCVAFFRLHDMLFGLIILVAQYSLLLVLMNEQYKYFENVIIITLISIWYAVSLVLNYGMLIIN